MDFWKEFSKTVSSTAESTVRGAERLTDMAKLKYKISSLNTKMNDAYTEVGKLRYAEKNGAPVNEEAYSELFEKIDDYNFQIAEAETELYDLMCFVSCPKCGTRMKKDCCYCPKCGEKR